MNAHYVPLRQIVAGKRPEMDLEEDVLVHSSRLERVPEDDFVAAE